MISLSQSVSREKEALEVYCLKMGRATELGRQPLCSVPGVGSLGSQDWSAPGKATEKLMEETHDGWVLLFPAGVWHSCYQKHFNWLANCMVTWKVSLRKWLCRLFSHLAGKCWDRVVAECQDFSGSMCEHAFTVLLVYVHVGRFTQVFRFCFDWKQSNSGVSRLDYKIIKFIKRS